VEVRPCGAAADGLPSCALEERFLRAATTSSDTITLDEVKSACEVFRAACEVCCAVADVVRALDATHSAVALRSPVSAGESEMRKSIEDAQDVGSGMRCQLR
jgi:hypothetical protein